MNRKSGQGTAAFKASPVKVTVIGHASMILEWGKDVVYVDPVGTADMFKGKPAPTLILVTHAHSDHFSTSTLDLFSTGNYAAFVPQAVKDLLKGNAIDPSAQVMKNGDVVSTGDLTITAVPMYNIPESPSAYHVKGVGNGYILEKDGYRVYIAGDTSATPEMKSLAGIDMAFIPMNLPYTMGVDEAASGVLAFRPAIVIPYHYREPAGLADVDYFKKLVNGGDPSIDVELLDWYPAK
jgi:L-ascorbate metabolism protein UlaG (beta-lactamase superfamily)